MVRTVVLLAMLVMFADATSLLARGERLPPPRWVRGFGEDGLGWDDLPDDPDGGGGGAGGGYDWWHDKGFWGWGSGWWRDPNGLPSGGGGGGEGGGNPGGLGNGSDCEQYRDSRTMMQCMVVVTGGSGGYYNVCSCVEYRVTKDGSLIASCDLCEADPRGVTTSCINKRAGEDCD